MDASLRETTDDAEEKHRRTHRERAKEKDEACGRDGAFKVKLFSSKFERDRERRRGSTHTRALSLSAGKKREIKIILKKKLIAAFEKKKKKKKTKRKTHPVPVLPL